MSNQSATSYNPGTLSYSKTYYWMIVSWDNYGEFSNGTIWSFTTAAYTPPQNPGGGGGAPPGPVNNPPIADTGGPYYEIKGVPITFDGSASNDSDGTIESYKWDFGDGSTDTGINPSHAYENPGNYTVKLTVTDNGGLTHSDTTFALISDIPNSPPNKPLVTGNKTGNRNIDYIYTAVSTDVDNDTVRYIFDWDDGTNTTTDHFESGMNCTVVHRWSTAGIYKIQVKAVDEHESISGTAELIVLIDSLYCEDIGYITDDDSDEIYDVFHSNQTGNATNLKYQNGNYLIDSNGDGKWDHIFNLEKGLSEYTQGSNNDKTLAISAELLVLIFIIVAIIIAAPFFLFKKRTSKNKVKTVKKNWKRK